MKHRGVKETAPPDTTSREGGERLQKILAHAGVASRRAAEEMIQAGRVKVNGQIVTEMGSRANPTLDKIEIDGRPLEAPPDAKKGHEHTYIMLNKPLGAVSTARDPQGRPTVLDLVRPMAGESKKPTPDPRKPAGQQEAVQQRVYPVGRLDADTTGLLLLTNDGDLTFRLTHPRFGIEKEYRALVRGNPNADALKRLREGVEIEGEKTAPAQVDEVGKRGAQTWLRIVIHEGRKRQVRLMCASVGHPVIELQRIRFGPLVLGNLEPGKWRYLALHEVHALRKAVKLRPERS
ncbi:MAG: pseudouridine synthase [Chloroflexota bacterium]